MGFGSFRNKNCFCGSKKKFKKCCMYKENITSTQELKTFLLKKTIKEVEKQQKKEKPSLE